MTVQIADYPPNINPIEAVYNHWDAHAVSRWHDKEGAAWIGGTIFGYAIFGEWDINNGDLIGFGLNDVQFGLDLESDHIALLDQDELQAILEDMKAEAFAHRGISR